VIELRENPLLARKPLAPRRRQPGIAQDLDGRNAAEIAALGQVDDAGAAFAERPHQTIRTERLTGDDGGLCVLGDGVRRGKGEIAIQQGCAVRILLQHLQDFFEERSVAATRVS